MLGEEIVDQFDHHAMKARSFLALSLIRHECFPFGLGPCVGRGDTAWSGIANADTVRTRAIREERSLPITY